MTWTYTQEVAAHARWAAAGVRPEDRDFLVAAADLPTDTRGLLTRAARELLRAHESRRPAAALAAPR